MNQRQTIGQLKLIDPLLELRGRCPCVAGRVVVEMQNITRVEKRLAARRLKRKDEKRRRRERDALTTQESVKAGNYVPKRTLVRQSRERMMEILLNAPKICIDCSFESLMSPKERSKFAQQLCRAYGANKSSPEPFSLHLTNFSMESALGICCRQKCSGFENYKIGFHAVSPAIQFPTSKLVYLSPEAQSPLLDLEPDTIYVIGGLVDENVRKGTSLAAADSLGVETTRLPLQEFGPEGWGAGNRTKSSALPINIVLSILLSYRQHKDWRKAFETNLPKRFQT
ncbi:tRNA (guanine(9)-N(1))-methyltransferase activity [Sparganum proliferum]